MFGEVFLLFLFLFRLYVSQKIMYNILKTCHIYNGIEENGKSDYWNIKNIMKKKIIKKVKVKSVITNCKKYSKNPSCWNVNEVVSYHSKVIYTIIIHLIYLYNLYWVTVQNTCTGLIRYKLMKVRTTNYEIWYR